MKTKYNLLLLPALLCLVGLPSIHAADRTWINASGGAFVGPTTNWAGGTIAGTGDVVFFDASGAPATYTVTLADNYTFQGLRNLAGDSVTVDLDGRTLTLSAASALISRGVFDIQDGTLSASTRTLDFGREGTATSKLSNVIASIGAANIGVVTVTSTDSSNSLLTLEAGTVLTASAATSIGGVAAAATGSTSTNSKLLVTGVGSAYNGADFRVGTSNSSNNTLEVASGATATGGGLLIGGYHSGGGVYSTGGNTVLVHGRGALPDQNSKITLTSNVTIGAANIATTVNNSLVVENDGELVTSGSLIINGTAGNTNNRVVIESGGNLTLNNTSNTINFGYMEVDGGSLAAKGLTINNQGRLNFLDGAINIDGNLTVSGGPGSRFAFDLTGDDPIVFSGIAVSGNISMTVGHFVDILGVSQAGAYTLFTNVGTSNASGRLALGNTPGGFAGTLIFNSNSIVLDVTAIPEPSAAMLLAVGLMVTVMQLRRRVHALA